MRKKILLMSLLLSLAPTVWGGGSSLPSDLSRLADASAYPRLAVMEDEERRELLGRLKGLSLERRVAALIFLQVGTPYQGGALGEGIPPDEDPLIRYDVTDCAILNLVAAALAHTGPGEDPGGKMLFAGYRAPSPGVTPSARFDTRLHFTSDRLDESPYFRDVTSRFGKTRSKMVILNRKKDGGKWIEIPWERAREVVYLPSREALRTKKWPEVLGVAFLKEKTLDNGLDVLHEGMLWKGKNVVHASSAKGKVIVESFAAMLKRYDGVVLFEYR